jgi:hypothetical protein
VFFASREGDEPRITPLATSEAFDLHLRNGFGEHENPAIWAFQFDAYHTLVEAVPHFTLSVPDDRERLGTAASWLLTELAAITNVA